MSRLISDLDCELQSLCNRLISSAKALNIELGVTQTFRTFAEQRELYSRGRTVPGAIVTYAPPGYSWHNWKRAFDVDILTFKGDQTPKNVWDGPWDTVGMLGENYGLIWGGRWKHSDRPHFERPNGQTFAQMLVLHPKGLETA